MSISDSPDPRLQDATDPATLIDVLRARTQNHPRGEAYRFLPDGEEKGFSLTYQELDQQARAIAMSLATRQAAGQRVLLLYPPGLDYITAFFGCLYAGAVAVPAYPPDSNRLNRTMPRLQAIVTDSQPALALTTASIATAIEPLFAEPASLRWPQLLATDTIADGPQDGWVPPAVDQNTLAFIMYTSGSTGVPKGVMVSHGNVLHNLACFPGFESRPCTAFVSWLPFFHDLGLMFGVLHPLYRGVPAILMSPVAFAQKPYRWLQAISRYGATTTGAPNFAYDLCARKTTAEERAALDLSRWNLALNGSEPVREETMQRFAAAFRSSGFCAEAFYPSYGLADATATVSGGKALAGPVAGSIGRDELKQNQVSATVVPEPNTVRLIGCGQTMAGQEIAIVNPETLTRCAADAVGEIWVKGPSVAQGYWNRPEESLQTFGARLQDTSEGPFLRTGDLGFLQAGELFITGRRKDLIIIWGGNHYPEDIEATVQQSHPALRPGCGAAFSIQAGGEEKLVIVHEIATAGVVAAADIIGNMRQAVAEYHGIDTHAIVLIHPGTIPKTSSGKIQRGMCRTRFLEDQLSEISVWQERSSMNEASSNINTHAINSNQPVGNKTSPRAQMIQDWIVSFLSRRIGLDKNEIDIRQPFTRYGLASLEAVTLSRELETLLNCSLAATLAWDYPTIEQLANHLAAAAAIPDPAWRNEPVTVNSAEPIAVVGMACRFPGAKNHEAYWRLLRDGVDAITEVPADRWRVDDYYEPDSSAPGKMVSRWGGFLENVDQFDALFFGISPREATHIDPRQRVMLELAWEALEDAGIPADSLAGSKTGVFLATLNNDYTELLFRDLQHVDAYSGPGTANSIIANRVSYFLDLRGPSLVLDTACSGSLVAIHLACQSLRSGETKMALVGGVSINLLPNGNIFFTKAGALSPDGHCKTFDISANGIVRSEGAGMVVLKPLSQALADKDFIYGVVRGSAVNSDGHSNGLMAPNRQAQEAVLRTAYQQAGVAPGQVQYIEAHGTGTSLGDPIEVQALASVLSEGRLPERVCAIGSAKTNLGHMEPAAGIAGVIKVCLAFRHRKLPPTLHFREPNPFIAFEDTPFRVQDGLGSWPSETEPLIAGVSSFGIGGTNAHVVLQEAPQISPAAQNRPSAEPCLLPISARSRQALQDLAAAYRQTVADASDDVSLRDICYAASVQRMHHDYRLAVQANSRQELAEALDAFLRDDARAGLAHGNKPLGEQLKRAFVFSGQGSHWLGMGGLLMQTEPVFAASMRRCDELLRGLTGWSLIDQLMTGETDSRLNETDVAQPAIFAVQVSLASLWFSWGIVPDVVIGQSLGEIAAAHIARVLTLEEAMRIVYHRSRLMKRTAGMGKTAVVGLPLEQAQLALTGNEDLVSVAGSNSPTASLLSGDPQALERIMKSLERQGYFCRMLQGVDVAFHSPQMEPLKGELIESLKGLSPRAATLPLASSVTGKFIDGLEMDANYWARNLREPFLFATALQTVVAAGYDTFVEVSPHPVLAPAILEGLRYAGRQGMVLPSLRRQEKQIETMLSSLGSLYAAGHPVDWRKIYPVAARRTALPSYPWQRERYWVDQLNGGKAAEKNNGRRVAGAHPLLGEHVKSALPTGEHFFEIDLSANAPAYLSQHKVQEAIIFPGAGYLEMVMAGASAAFGAGPFALESVAFKHALFLPEGDVRRVQLVFSPEASGRASFHIYSLPVGLDRTSGRWVLHVTGKLHYGTELADAEAPKIDCDPVEAGCQEMITRVEHYQGMDSRGLYYGPNFQAIEQIWRREGEAIGQLELPGVLQRTSGAYLMHPIIVDAGFQIISATLPIEQGGPASETYIPVQVGKVRLYKPLGNRVRCHARLRLMDADNPRGDIFLVDEGGEVLAEILDLCLQRLGGVPETAHGNPGDLLYEMQWHPKPHQNSARRIGEDQLSRPSKWLIFADRAGVGEEFAELLEEQGEGAIVISPGEDYHLDDEVRSAQINPARPDDFHQLLFDVLDSQEAQCRGVVHLWSLDAPQTDGLTHAALERSQTIGLAAVMHTVQALSGINGTPPPRLWLVTRGAQPVDSKAEALTISQSPLWGLSRVIAREYPMLWGGIIDLDPASPTDEARMLFDEVCQPDGEDAIAFRSADRYVSRLARRRDLAVGPLESVRLTADGAYLITGGLGGLGLTVARWMVEHGARRLILMGRSKLPPRSAWHKVADTDAAAEQIAVIRELEAHGASVTLARVDVADDTQMAAFFANYDEHGCPPIRGIIHAAGVAKDQLLIQMDAETVSEVLKPKVSGAWLLHRHFEDTPLDFFVMFSSAAPILGEIGQGSYAGANAFMDALAHLRRARGLSCSSINWGPWNDTGMASRRYLTKQFEQRGLSAISSTQGLRILEQVLSHDTIQAVVLSAKWDVVSRFYPRGANTPLIALVAHEEEQATPAFMPDKDKALLEQLLQAEPEQRQSMLEVHIQGVAAEILGLDRARLNLRQPLDAVGMDSIMAVSLKNRIEVSLGVSIPIVELLQGTTLARLASQLLYRLTGSASHSPLEAGVKPAAGNGASTFQPN